MPPGEQITSVLDGSGCVRGAGWVVLSGMSTALDRYVCRGVALASWLGAATPAPQAIHPEPRFSAPTGWRSAVGAICSRSLSPRPAGMLWGGHRYQEQERNRSRECSGTYPNCCQLPPMDPSWAGDSLFPQVSRVCG
jgi:hypothetical protein